MDSNFELRGDADPERVLLAIETLSREGRDYLDEPIEDGDASLAVWATTVAGTLEWLCERVPETLAARLRRVVAAAGVPVTAEGVAADIRDELAATLDDLASGCVQATGIPPSPMGSRQESPTSCWLCGRAELDGFGPMEEAAGGVFDSVCACAPHCTLGTVWFPFVSDEARRAALWLARTRERRHLPQPLFCPGPIHQPEGTAAAFSMRDVESAVPRGVRSLADELLITLAGEQRTVGSTGGYVNLGQRDEPLVLGREFVDLLFHVQQLERQGLVELESPYTGGLETLVRLTVAGWQRVEDLEAGVVEKPNQGFVAMWFDEELRRVFRDGIEPAIRDAGYDPMQMAFLEHNDDINDRIIAEIRKSRFVVADFTGNRGGVYFEAGFALGLGKPVIWTCRRDFFEEHGVHFDTQARNHILWDDVDDLRSSLRARIEATIPHEP